MSVFGSDNNNRRPGDKDRSRTQNANSNRSSSNYDGREGGGLGAKQRNQLIGAIILIVLAAILAFYLLGSNDQDKETTEPASPVVSPNGGQNSQSLSIETSPRGEAGEQPMTDANGQPNEQGAQPDGSEPGSTTAEEGPQQPAPGTSGQGSIAQSTNPDYTPNFGESGTSSEESDEEDSGNQDQSVAQSTGSKPAEQAKPKASKPAETAKSKPKTQSKPAPTSKSSNRIADKDRTDDGSQAAALLAGKTPGQTSAPQSASTVTPGNFSIQLASLSTADSARQERNKLNKNGVSNAFVQIAQVNGKNTYRVKVGPYKSKESAQANLTRFRQMGYGGAMVTGK